MNLSAVQLAILSKLEVGDSILGKIDTHHGGGWRFEIWRNYESVFIGRIGCGMLKIATVDSLVKIGLLRETTRGFLSGEWEVTADGVSLGDCGMTVAEKQELSDAIDRRAEQGPLGKSH